MLIPNLKTINCCIICRSLNKDGGDYEYLFTELKDDFKIIVQLTEMGYLYEEFIGIKISLDSYQRYPKLLCSSCGLQMKLLKKLKVKALETLKALNGELYNVQKEIATSESVPKGADVINEDPIEYEQIEFIIDELNESETENNENCNDPGADGYNKIVENRSPVFNDDSIEQNNDTALFCSITTDNLITKEKLNYVTLELADDIVENDYITQICEIPQTCDADHGDDVGLNETVADAKKVSQEQGSTISSYVYQQCPKQRARKFSSSATSAQRDIKCELCNIEFNSIKDMKAHGDDAHNGKYPCGQCLKFFTSIKSLRVHTNLHKGQLKYHCDLCPRAFNQKVHYQTHMRQHKNDRNFQCATCEKAFFTKADLKIHERKHSGQRPHICEICGKDFVLAVHLTMHQYSHTQEKKFPCDYCKRSFVTPNTLRLHKQTIHLRERQFHCEYCTKPFRRKHHLMYHVKNIHQNGFLMANAEGQRDHKENVILMSNDCNNVIEANHIDNDAGKFIYFTNDALII